MRQRIRGSGRGRRTAAITALLAIALTAPLTAPAYAEWWAPMLRDVENLAMPRTAAFFDLDKTVIAKSSTLTFGKSFYQG
ncbi:hypothetical protein ACFW15_26775, partial [Streptomyces sp. NPDC058953]